MSSGRSKAAERLTVFAAGEKVRSVPAAEVDAAVSPVDKTRNARTAELVVFPKRKTVGKPQAADGARPCIVITILPDADFLDKRQFCPVWGRFCALPNDSAVCVLPLKAHLLALPIVARHTYANGDRGSGLRSRLIRCRVGVDQSGRFRCRPMGLGCRPAGICAAAQKNSAKNKRSQARNYLHEPLSDHRRSSRHTGASRCTRNMN